MSPLKRLTPCYLASSIRLRVLSCTSESREARDCVVAGPQEGQQLERDGHSGLPAEGGRGARPDVALGHKASALTSPTAPAASAPARQSAPGDVLIIFLCKKFQWLLSTN